MALTTRNKRASALGIAVATFALVLPNPDGLTLDQGDRQQTAFCYRGIAARSPILTLPTVHPVLQGAGGVTLHAGAGGDTVLAGAGGDTLLAGSG